MSIFKFSLIFLAFFALFLACESTGTGTGIDTFPLRVQGVYDMLVPDTSAKYTITIEEKTISFIYTADTDADTDADIGEGTPGRDRKETYTITNFVPAAHGEFTFSVMITVGTVSHTIEIMEIYLGTNEILIELKYPADDAIESKKEVIFPATDIPTPSDELRGTYTRRP